MTVGTYSITGSSDVAEIWRKIQGRLADAINYLAKPFDWMTEAKDAMLAPSTREVTRPVNLALRGGVAQIPEGGYEAYPGTPTATDLTFALVQYNARFTISELVKIIDQNAGANATQIESQLKFSGRHMLNAMIAALSDDWFGKSTGVLAQTNTNIATATEETLTLTAGYAESWITDPAYLARKFQAGSAAGVGDRIALLNGSTLITNATGLVVARSTTNGSIRVQFDGAVGTSTDGLNIVRANSLDNTVNGYNRGLVGLTDVLTSISVHGVSSSSQADWAAALADTNGGRFNGARYMKGVNEIENLSPYSPTRLLMADGVYRDVFAQYSSQLRFSDAFAMPIDGAIKAKGIQILRDRRCPPKFVALWADQAYQRFFGKPELAGQIRGMSYGDLKKLENQSGSVASANYVGNLTTNSRRAFAYWTGLDES